MESTNICFQVSINFHILKSILLLTKHLVNVILVILDVIKLILDMIDVKPNIP